MGGSFVRPSILGFVAGGGLARDDVRDKTVLEVGGANWNGTVKPIVEAFKPTRYVVTDASDGPGVDQVVAAEHLVSVFGKDAFDVVICTETLQYVDDWKKALENMLRVLRPNGIILITAKGVGHPPNLPSEPEVP